MFILSDVIRFLLPFGGVTVPVVPSVSVPVVPSVSVPVVPSVSVPVVPSVSVPVLKYMYNVPVLTSV